MGQTRTMHEVLAIVTASSSKLTRELNSKARLPFVLKKHNGMSMACHIHMYELQPTATEINDKWFFCATRKKSELARRPASLCQLPIVKNEYAE